MRRLTGAMARRAAGAFGYELRRPEQPRERVGDVDDTAASIVEKVRPFTMTPPERIVALVDALRYVTRAGLDGAVVECGVWRGGSMMAAALTLIAAGDTGRDLYLFDTFTGMTEPSDHDVDITGASARRIMTEGAPPDDLLWDHAPAFACAPIDDVRHRLESTGYPPERLHFVEGRVEDTIPGHAPERIALLRLDTDWYESTRHELEHLYPRIVDGGVLILDDYGHWAGSRKATDEYVEQHNLSLLFTRIDYAARMAVVTRS